MFSYNMLHKHVTKYMQRGNNLCDLKQKTLARSTYKGFVFGAGEGI